MRSSRAGSEGAGVSEGVSGLRVHRTAAKPIAAMPVPARKYGKSQAMRLKPLSIGACRN
jgi:hypothetical protein